MKTRKNIYPIIYSLSNLILAWKKARKGKTRRDYVINFERDTLGNLLKLQRELEVFSYQPRPLKTFILRDPKVRRISKSDFRDRVIHHALCNIIELLFDKMFIHDSYANRKGKGNLEAVKRLHSFMQKVSRNGELNGRFNDNQVKGYCLKADIKHYFQEVNHDILIKIIRKMIDNESVIWLIRQILGSSPKGMPLGNLTSQFFANVYMNELDYFVKHELKARYYIRYVDDFVILHQSKSQLDLWRELIDDFLRKKLDIELHPEKSKVTPLSRGIDFVGFRNFYYFRLLRKRNIRKMMSKIEQHKGGMIPRDKILESFQGWQAYAKWANTFRLRKNILDEIQN